MNAPRRHSRPGPNHEGTTSGCGCAKMGKSGPSKPMWDSQGEPLRKTKWGQTKKRKNWKA